MREPLFSIRNLSKIFPNGYRALSGLSLDIYRGECLLVAGSNGSGKTVLMRILAALTDYSAGEILFRGRPLRDSVPLLRRSLGLVFQDAEAQLVGETVEEDLRFGPENLKLPEEEILKRVEGVMETFGLGAKRDFPPRRLSGGEKRRLAAAGVLAMGCDVIVMDEPFANLDWPGVVRILGTLEELKKQDKTLIILTHELEKVLAFADRLIILDGGILRDEGRPGEVLDRLDPSWGVRDPRRSYKAVEDCNWLIP